MARKKVFGNCRICGIYTKLSLLSFEHVPPRAAFNDCTAAGKQIFELINKDPDHYFEGKRHISQRDAGAHTLCEKCNYVSVPKILRYGEIKNLIQCKICTFCYFVITLTTKF